MFNYGFCGYGWLFLEKFKKTAKKWPALKLEVLRNGEPLNLKNF